MLSAEIPPVTPGPGSPQAPEPINTSQTGQRDRRAIPGDKWGLTGSLSTHSQMGTPTTLHFRESLSCRLLASDVTSNTLTVHKQKQVQGGKEV